MKYIVSLMKFTIDIFYVMNENLDFVDYLLMVMEEKGLIPADITKRSGLSPSHKSLRF